MKKCFKCNEIKSIGSFYKHSGMKDGHLNKCIDCTKKDVSTREQELRKDEEWLEKERKRGRDKHHRLNYTIKYKPLSYKGMQNKHRKKYPEKYKANMAVANIKTKGEKHHWSYNKEHYKDFIELDKRTHSKLHRYMIYDQERMMYRTTKSIGTFDKLDLLDTKERHLTYLENIKHLI